MTADLEQATALDQMGPVDYIVVAFPTDRMSGEALPLLVDLVDRGVIRILDLVFLRKDREGVVTTLTQVDLERMHLLEAALFDGASSGLLDDEDVAEAAAALEPGTAAGVLVYENAWAAPCLRRPPLGRAAGRRGARPRAGPRGGPRRPGGRGGRRPGHAARAAHPRRLTGAVAQSSRERQSGSTAAHSRAQPRSRWRSSPVHRAT
ncbi:MULTISPECIES: DUF6325 family protein [unclassified Blastococcus]